MQKHTAEVFKVARIAQVAKQLSSKISQIIYNDFNEELIKVYKVFKCKRCDYATKLKRGEVNYNLTDCKGLKITEDAAINCNLNKIECENCKMNYCNKCKSEPYHIGYTCEQYKEYLSLRKCRFCHTIFGDKKQNQSDKEAFEMVCNSEECIKLML